MKSRPAGAILLLFMCCLGTLGQKSTQIDPITGQIDSLPVDSIVTIDSLLDAEVAVNEDSIGISAFDSLPIRYAQNDDISDPIQYKAADSFVFYVDSMMMYLYKDADMDYDDISLQAGLVEFDWNAYTLTAEGLVDSSGKVEGEPVFSQGGSDFNAKKISYNFKTQKGKVYDVLTREGEGYIHAEAVKRNEYNEWYGLRTRYTTCDHDEPHFYLEAKKMKMVPDKLIVTGPVNLVIADVHTPLWLPFGIFPTKKGQRSGIIFPQWGESNALGFFLKDGGYYFGINDRVDFQITGELYSKGSWGLAARTNYNVRYKFRGNLNFSYFRRRPTNPEVPGSTSSNDFRFGWTHNQDRKARPNTTFTANVNGSTSTYRTNSLTVNDDRYNTQLTSSIRFSKNWSGRPISFSISASHSQNLLTRNISFNLPIITFTLSRINPFVPKVKSGKKKWYESIGFRYNMEAKSFLSTVDSTLFTAQTLDAMKYGVRHRVTIDAPTTVFKYINLNPSFGYTDRWYFQKIDKAWVEDSVQGGRDFRRVDTDTTFGFYSVRDWNLSVSISTRMFGMYRINGKNLKAIRHELIPSVSFSYRPDFGKDRFGYYDEVQVSDDGEIDEYSHYDIARSVYGVPGQGLQAALSFSLNNRLEMKVRSKKDTVTGMKKMVLLDRLNISGSYNFAADSLKITPIRFTGSSTIIDGLNITFDWTLDPLAVNDNNQRINETVWSQKKRFFRLVSAGFRLDGGFSSNQLKRIKETDKGSPEEQENVLNNLDQYYDFNNPWSFNLGYVFDLRRGTAGNPDTSFITQSITFRTDFNLTPKWKFAVNSAYDITRNEVGITNVRVIRDLHCWEMSFNWTAFPVELQTYAIEIRVRSSILQDLKLSKKQQYLDNPF